MADESDAASRASCPWCQSCATPLNFKVSVDALPAANGLANSSLENPLASGEQPNVLREAVSIAQKAILDGYPAFVRRLRKSPSSRLASRRSCRAIPLATTEANMRPSSQRPPPLRARTRPSAPTPYLDPLHPNQTATTVRPPSPICPCVSTTRRWRRLSPRPESCSRCRTPTVGSILFRASRAPLRASAPRPRIARQSPRRSRRGPRQSSEPPRPSSEGERSGRCRHRDRRAGPRA